MMQDDAGAERYRGITLSTDLSTASSNSPPPFFHRFPPPPRAWTSKGPAPVDSPWRTLFRNDQRRLLSRFRRFAGRPSAALPGPHADIRTTGIRPSPAASCGADRPLGARFFHGASLPPSFAKQPSGQRSQRRTAAEPGCNRYRAAHRRADPPPENAAHRPRADGRRAPSVALSVPRDAAAETVGNGDQSMG